MNKYSFIEMLKIFKVSRLFFCLEAYLSVFIPTVMFYLMYYIDRTSLKSMILEISKFLIASDVAMLAIVISGFAIVLSVSGSDFLYFLKRKDLNIRFFFPFYLSSVLWGVHTIFSIGLFLLASTSLENDSFYNFLIALLFVYMSLFIYALLNSISLVKTIMRLGFEKVRLDEQLDNINPKLLNSEKTNDT